MRFICMIIVILCFIDINVVDARRGGLPQNYLKNLDKKIDNFCNRKTFNITGNKDVFHCVKNANSNCYLLANYSEFSKKKQLCIKNKQNDYSFCIIITIVVWVVIAICSSTSK